MHQLAFGSSLARRKEIIGIIIAAGILTAIFVPFQRASAFTVDLSLPNATGNSITQNASGDNFKVVVNVEAGELFTIANIDVILDSGQSGAKFTHFKANGDPEATPGSLDIVKGNKLTITTDTTTSSGYAYGYAYGYGYAITNGHPFTFPYSFTNYGYGFIGGNQLGYANSAGGTAEVAGFVGPIKITITGKLNTAEISAGSHTLDVLIYTNAGGNGVDQLVAPRLSFTVTANNQVVVFEQTLPANTETPFTIPATGAQIVIKLANGGVVEAIEQKTLTTLLQLQTQNPGIFSSTPTSTIVTFTAGSTTINAVGEVFEISVSGSTGSVTVTVPFNPSLVPSGQTPTLFRWTGTAWEEATNVSVGTNTITGTFSGLSPVVAGVTSGGSTTTPTSGSSSSGGGVVVDLTLYPESYFVLNPLSKFKVLSTAFVNAQGIAVTEASVGQQIGISSSFRNYQQQAQPYAYIVQVEDENGVVMALEWQEGSADSGQTVQLSRTWTAEQEGTYTVKIFLWSGVYGLPVPLTDGVVQHLSVAQ